MIVPHNVFKGKAILTDVWDVWYDKCWEISKVWKTLWSSAISNKENWSWCEESHGSSFKFCKFKKDSQQRQTILSSIRLSCLKEIEIDILWADELGETLIFHTRVFKTSTEWKISTLLPPKSYQQWRRSTKSFSDNFTTKANSILTRITRSCI